MPRLVPPKAVETLFSLVNQAEDHGRAMHVLKQECHATAQSPVGDASYERYHALTSGGTIVPMVL